MKKILVIFVIICSISNEILTKNSYLIGKRNFGIDYYTGIYVSNYSNKTKKETIFGGTTLNRDEDNINIKIYL